MKHFGDITKLDVKTLPIVDVITGGSPCQDLSVAGKRAGLEGERSGLFMEQIRIVKEMREHDRTVRGTNVDIRDIRPRYMVWENVPGVFSSNKGQDFRAVLEETCRIADKTAIVPMPEGGRWSTSGCILGEGWSVAWRVHDAQFWGVPQRRKRISLVADFGGSSAPEILFESKSLSGNLEQGKQKGEETSGVVGKDFDETSKSYTLKIRGGREVDSAGKKAGKGPLVQEELSATLGVSQDQTLIQVKDEITSGVVTKGNGEAFLTPDKHTSLSTGGGQAGQGYPCVMQDTKVYGISSYDSNSMKSDNPNSGIYEADTTRTLDLNGGNPACNQGGMIVLEGNGSRPSHKGDGYAESDVSYTLNGTEQHGVCTYQDKTGPLMASGYDKLGTQEAMNDMYVVSSSWDGSQTSPTLTANNADGSQRMPDKDNFNAVISLETYHCTTEENKTQTLKARDYKDPHCVVCGVDAYNQSSTGDKAKSLTSGATDSDHIPCVAYGVDSYNQTAQLEKADTLRTNGGGDNFPKVCYAVDQGAGKSSADVLENKSPTLATTHYGEPAVCYGLDRASFNQGQNAQYDFSVEEDLAQTIVSRGPGGGY